MEMKIILASSSPRRSELLRLICPAFEVCPSKAEERLQAGAPLSSEILRLAHDKAVEVLSRTAEPCCVIGADTMVVLDGQAMGKPKDAEDALRMLRTLSGRTHEVLTAVTVLTDDGRTEQMLSRTAVAFYALTEDEIQRYVATGEPLDKAGAYGIQGMGAMLVERLEGDFYGVMGLPIARLYRMLRCIGAMG